MGQIEIGYDEQGVPNCTCGWCHENKVWYEKEYHDCPNDPHQRVNDLNFEEIIGMRNFFKLNPTKEMTDEVYQKYVTWCEVTNSPACSEYMLKRALFIKSIT